MATIDDCDTRPGVYSRRLLVAILLLGSPCYAPLVRGDAVNDTSPEAEAVLIEGIRRMTPAEKIAMVRSLTRRVISTARSGVVRRHPDASDREVDLYLASRWLDPDLMLRAFGWDVRSKGY